MKKINYLLLGAAAIMMASCSQDDLQPNLNADGTATVTLNLSTPEIATRFGEGASANKLSYRVYELNDGVYKAVDEAKTQDFNIKGTVSVNLLAERDYAFVFWAANENSPYEVTLGDDAATMTYKAEATLNANDENHDAFYAHETLTLSGNMSVDVELYRPFAQVNIGTSDYSVAKMQGDLPSKSAVTVNNVYTAMDLVSGDVTGETSDMEFGEAEIPYDFKQMTAIHEYPKTGFEYLGVAYVLVPKDRQVLSNVSFSFTDSKSKKTRSVVNVPLKRNYRTNIYGNVLTSTAALNVELIPGFGGDNDYSLVDVEDGKAKYNNTTYETLTAALEAAKAAGNLQPIIFL